MYDRQCNVNGIVESLLGNRTSGYEPFREGDDGTGDFENWYVHHCPHPPRCRCTVPSPSCQVPDDYEEFL